jgi:hypothetical protein
MKFSALLVVVLEDEASLADAKDRDLPIKRLLKPERLVKALAQCEILRRQEWAREFIT